MPHSFRNHLGIYLVFVVFFVLVWALSGGGYFWPLWPALGWGLGVAIHGVVVLNTRPSPSRRPELRTTSVFPGEQSIGRSTTSLRTVSSTRRRWITVMFTDIANSTSLNEALGDEEWSRFLARHREAVRGAVRDRDGNEVGTQGDGLLARFASPADAVLCAIDIQRKIDEIKAGGGLVPRLRIGVHAGEAVEDDGDVVGRVVNLAARVTAEAAPGEILITEPVADELAGRMELEDRGLRPLRGVQQPRHLLAVLWS